MTNLGTIDFADAFHTLFAHPSERGKLVFEAVGKWYVYKRIPFGLASAPLLWARLAAACMRISQALWSAKRLQLQCYVDDPAFVVFGPARPLLAQLFLFWEVLGCKMAYKKGSLGKSIEWIAVTVSIGCDSQRGLYVKLSIPRAKLEQLQHEIAGLQSANLVDSKRLVSAASRMSWVGGILPWMRGFSSCFPVGLQDIQNIGHQKISAASLCQTCQACFAVGIACAQWGVERCGWSYAAFGALHLC